MNKWTFGPSCLLVFSPSFVLTWGLPQGASLDDARQAFPIPMGPPGATVSSTPDHTVLLHSS